MGRAFFIRFDIFGASPLYALARHSTFSNLNLSEPLPAKAELQASDSFTPSIICWFGEFTAPIEPIILWAIFMQRLSLYRILFRMENISKPA